MVKRILLSTAVLFALATTSWAQGSGCSACDAQSSGDISYSVDDVGQSEGFEQWSDDSSNYSIGQGYFTPVDCGCSNDYKYARLFAGAGYVEDNSIVGIDADFEDGWGGGGSIGRRKGRRRTELELGYRHNSFDLFAGGVGPLANGNLSTTTGMVNVMFDVLKIGKKLNVYSGGGIGILYGDFHIVSDGGFAFDDTAFAYQRIVGVDRDIRRGMKGFVEYRYLTAEIDFGGEDLDYDAHNIFFGIEMRR